MILTTRFQQMATAVFSPLTTLRTTAVEIGGVAVDLAAEMSEALAPAKGPLDGLRRLELFVLEKIANSLERVARERRQRIVGESAEAHLDPDPGKTDEERAAPASPPTTRPASNSTGFHPPGSQTAARVLDALSNPKETGAAVLDALSTSAETGAAVLDALSTSAGTGATAIKNLGRPTQQPPPSLEVLFRRQLDRTLEPAEEDKPPEHPAFRTILRQLVPDEALILSLLAKRDHVPLVDIKAGPRLGREGKTVAPHLSTIAETVGVRHPDLVPSYIDNLLRLGLVKISRPDPDDRDVYELLEAGPQCEAIRRKITEEMKLTPKFRRKLARLTTFGKKFCEACSA